MTSKKQKIVFIVLVTLIITMMLATTVFASTDPGVDFGNWLQRNVQGIFIGIIAVIGIGLLLSRQFMKAVVTIVFAAIAAIFIFGGSDFAQKIGNIVKSWF